MALPGFSTDQNLELQSIMSKARYELSLWLPINAMSSQLESQFERKVLRPAVKFHQDRQPSTTQYLLERVDTSELDRMPNLLENWNVKNVDTWTSVKIGEQIETILHCLHPSLICVTSEGLVRSMLVKPVIVVRLMSTEGYFPDKKMNELLEQYQTSMGVSNSLIENTC